MRSIAQSFEVLEKSLGDMPYILIFRKKRRSYVDWQKALVDD